MTHSPRLLASLQALTPQALAALSIEVKAKLLNWKYDSYFPDTGPLRRELYQKHLEFFRQGATKSIRCFMAANRIGKCCLKNSKIDTPSGHTLIQDLRSGDMVMAWDGHKKVATAIHQPFKKAGLHECALVLMSDGRWIGCADHHRILLSGEWRLLSECLPRSFFCRPQSIVGRGLSVLLLGGLSWIETAQGWAARYFVCFRPCGVLPQMVEETGQAFAPLPAGVQEHTWSGVRRGDRGNISSDTRLHRPLPRQSSLGGLRLIVARCVAWTAQAGYRRAAPNLLKRPVVWLLNAAASAGLRLTGGVALQDSNVLPSRIATWNSPDIDGNRIIAVIPIGRHEVYDFTVPGYHNYCASGLAHHNTEGAGGYELTLHLTGRYPDWWEGTCFDQPIRAWCAGDTSKTVREILQEKLLGPWGKFGTGLIPLADIVRFTGKTGVPEAVDTVWTRHKDADGKYDGDSKLEFKSYDQKRQAFQGTEQDVIWLDEESDEHIRGECILRLMTTDGLLIETFTPLRGITPIVMQYLPKGEVTGEVIESEDRALIMAGWDDVPHLGEKEKKRMLAETLPYLRDARSKGIPSLGAGAIYPIQEEEFLIPDFPIPDHFKRLYALDVGWNRTAALFAAKDEDNDIIYLIGEHYRGQAEPSIHADAIRSRGKGLAGVIDPAARGRSQADGESLLVTYKELGLILKLANNAREAGIMAVWQRLSTGRLKVFTSLNNFKNEYRIYRRNEKGAIIKEHDHLMDDVRYLCMAKPEDWRYKEQKQQPFIVERGMLDPELGY